MVERIRDEWEEDSSRVLSLVAGQEVPLSAGNVSARVLAPDAKLAGEFFRGDGLKERIKKRANDVSAVVEIAFGDLRLVLGGDLPETFKGAVVPTGWRRVCETFGQQREHGALKVPHHGSLEALADCLVTPRQDEEPRTWVVTPYNVRPRLPSFEPRGGVDQLLAAEAELHLTAMPRAWKAQAPLPASVARSSVRAETAGAAGRLGALGPGTPAGNSVDLVVGDCVWGLVFDRDGRLVERYRGAGSTLVERG